MKEFTVMLVDDHALVRAGIKGLIDQLENFTVVAEASDMGEAQRKLPEANPDIVVTDITMGSASGLELARWLKAEYPHIATVILSMHGAEDIVAEALRAGASAYLLKEAAPNELEIALRAVSRKETYLSPAVSTKMIERFVRADNVVPSPLRSLTARQIQILTMIAQRKRTKEIAYELNLSEKTVAAHRAQIMERIGVHDVVGLVLFAVQHGLVKSAD